MNYNEAVTLAKQGKWAFYQADLREVYLPDGVERIMVRMPAS